MRYQICNKCVMDTSDPGISFDASGICDHCKDFFSKTEPLWIRKQNDVDSLKQLIEEMKKEGKGRDYDCLLGMSGGIDSSFMLHQAVTVYGLRPLVFHVDGGWNTPESLHNIRAIVNKLGLKLHVTTINWDEMRNFQIALFRSGTPYLDQAQDHCFVSTLYNYAFEHGIKHIINGGNLSTESVRYPLKYYYYGTDMRFIKDVLDQFGDIPMKTYPFSSVFRHKLWLRYVKGVKVVRLLDYIPYTKDLAVKTLKNEYGWKDYKRKHFESIFTRYLEGYILPTRFGFDPYRNQLSGLIVTGQMSRDEALHILKDPFPFYPKALRETDKEIICHKLGFSMEELDCYINMPKKYYWDFRNQMGMINLGAMIMKVMGLARAGAR